MLWLKSQLPRAPAHGTRSRLGRQQRIARAHLLRYFLAHEQVGGEGGAPLSAFWRELGPGAFPPRTRPRDRSTAVPRVLRSRWRRHAWQRCGEARAICSCRIEGFAVGRSGGRKAKSALEALFVFPEYSGWPLWRPRYAQNQGRVGIGRSAIPTRPWFWAQRGCHSAKPESAGKPKSVYKADFAMALWRESAKLGWRQAAWMWGAADTLSERFALFNGNCVLKPPSFVAPRPLHSIRQFFISRPCL